MSRRAAQPPLPAASIPNLLSKLGSTATASASRNPTRAVLQTSFNSRPRNLDQTFLFDGARYEYSSGLRSGRSSETARFDGEMGAAADDARSTVGRLE